MRFSRHKAELEPNAQFTDFKMTLTQLNEPGRASVTGPEPYNLQNHHWMTSDVTWFVLANPAGICKERAGTT